LAELALNIQKWKKPHRWIFELQNLGIEKKIDFPTVSELLTKKLRAGHQWLTPAILATQEAEIRGSWFKARPGKSLRNPISKKFSTKK
jgi:hypothetical protein